MRAGILPILFIGASLARPCRVYGMQWAFITYLWNRPEWIIKNKLKYAKRQTNIVENLPRVSKKNCNGLGNIVQKLKKICILSILVSLPCFNQHDEDTKEELSILKKTVEDKNSMSKTKKDSKKYAKKCLIYNEKMATLTK